MNKTYMSFEIPERLNKIIFWKYTRKQKLIQSPPQKLQQSCLLMPSSIFIISLKHVSVVCDGVCFY